MERGAMIYYDGTLIGGFDPDLAYEEAAEIGAELRQRQKLLDLYYDCANIIDFQPPFDRLYSLRERIDKFFRDNLNKSL